VDARIIGLPVVSGYASVVSAFFEKSLEMASGEFEQQIPLLRRIIRKRMILLRPE